MKVLGPSMFVAIFGDLHPHSWLTPDTLQEDAYSLFLSRSELMGWSRAGGAGLWGMNDASFDLSAKGGGRVAWVQVGVEESAVDGAAFPFHPLLTGARDALGRVGELDVEAVQFLVPLQIGGTPATISSVPNWFTTCNPASHVRMRVTVDSGEDPIMPQIANDVAELAARIARDPFTVAGAPVGAPPVQLLPEVTDGFWLGEGRHPVSFDTVAPDWSVDSLGWTAHLLTESCRRAGVKTSILINIGKQVAV